MLFSIKYYKDAAWNLYLTCGECGLVKTFIANEWEDDNTL